MAYIKAIDPRGFQIECDKKQWENHILTRHPELNGLENDIIKAIEEPTHGIIYESHLSKSRQVYYGKSPYHRAEMMVIVEIKESGYGKVISARLNSNRPSGEKIIWPITNP